MHFKPKLWWDRFRKDSYLQNSTILFFFTFAGSILQYIFQIYSNRNLSKDDYGLMNALLSLFVITSVVGLILRTWNTKVFSQIYSLKAFGEIKRIFLKFYAYLFAFLGLFILLFLIFSQNILQAYQTKLFWPFVLLILWLILDYLKIPLFSFLESFHSFFYRSLALFINAFLRTLLLFVFIYTHLNLNKVMLTQVISVAISVVFFIFFTLKEIHKLPKEERRTTRLDSHELQTALKIGIALLFNTLILNIDMQVARIHLEPHLSGDFAIASVLGKTVFWFASISVPVFFVSINNAFYKGKSVLKPFLKGSGILLLMTAGSLIAFLVFLKPFVYLFNPNYLSALPTIRTYTFSVLPYIGINFLVYFFISTNHYNHFLPLVFLALLQSIVLWIFGNTMATIIQIRAWSGSAIFAIMLIQLMSILKKRSKIKESSV